MEDRVITYAQNREDMILAAFFPDKKDGFYVDIGAHHPIEDSVTKYFYELGWHGINIEPNKRLFNLIAEDRPRDLNLNIGVSDKPGELKLRIYDNGDGLSTFSTEAQEANEKEGLGVTAKYHDSLVQVLPLKEIFKKNNVQEIDFLKVDVEGYEYNVLVSNDWQRFRPSVLCIEANHILQDWRPLLKKNKYSKVFFDGLNEYYVAQEKQNLWESFSYVQSLIGRNIVPLKIHSQINTLVRDNDFLTLENSRLQNSDREKEDEINRLNAHIFEHTKLRVLLKDIVRAVDKSISVRLSEHSRAKKYYPSIKTSKSHSLSKDELHKIIRKYDRIAFYSKPSVTQSIVTSIFRFTETIYKIIKKTLRKVLRGLRSVKRRGN